MRRKRDYEETATCNDGSCNASGWMCRQSRSGSYDIVIHIDDSKELRGTGVDYEYPESTEVIMFTSDDETVKGMIDFFALEASFYVTETDGSVVGPEGAYTFTFKY